MVLVLLAASSLKKDLGLQTCLAALAITTVLCIKSRGNPIRLAREISWGTPILVAGLFVMVDAVERMGALNLTKGWLASAQKLPLFGALVVGFIVGVANNLVNNLPLGLIAGGTLPGRTCKGSYRARRSDWRQSWTKSLGDRFARYNSLAPRPAQGKARCKFLALSQDRCSRDAHSSVVLNRRRHPDGHAISHLIIRRIS
jgi:Na+/H+ antiporter NhaD/arsenite permease-like protein